MFITSAAGGGIQNEIIKEESRGQIGTIDRTQYDLEDYKDRNNTVEVTNEEDLLLPKDINDMDGS